MTLAERGIDSLNARVCRALAVSLRLIVSGIVVPERESRGHAGLVLGGKRAGRLRAGVFGTASGLTVEGERATLAISPVAVFARI